MEARLAQNGHKEADDISVELTNEFCHTFSCWLKFRRGRPVGGRSEVIREQRAAPRILLTGCILPGFRLSLG